LPSPSTPQVQDLARRGELADVEVEQVDSMTRTMRLSLGPIPQPGSALKANTTVGEQPSTPSSGAGSAPPSPRFQTRKEQSTGLRLVLTVRLLCEHRGGSRLARR
jgi:hypothetical protein